MTSQGTGAAGARQQLGGKVLEQAQALQAVKSAGLRMFESMVEAVRKERDGDDLAEVQDLLEKMTKNFASHEAETREHERRLRERIDELGGDTSTKRELGLGAAAVLRAFLGRVGGQNYGANARDAFVFEHVEIATAELLEFVAERAGDEQTERLARDCKSDDEEMAAMIRRNFPNVLSLMLASEELPTFREAPDEDGG